MALELKSSADRCGSDPIPAFERTLRSAGIADDAGLMAIETGVAEEIDDAVAFAESGSDEPVEQLTRHVYAEEMQP